MMVTDVDTYFLKNPFPSFRKTSFDVGVTTRLHSYKFPINSGVFFVKPNENARHIFGELFDIYRKTQPEHKDDWFIDQDFLNYIYKTNKRVQDVGWEYNFCPNTDVFGVKMAADMIRRAYESRSVKVLHLKSELKMCIYDGFLEHAVTKHCNGGWNWKEDGK